jgi:hypothetical protein
MGPIDYTAGQTSSADLMRSLQGGVQLGAGIQAVQQQQAQQQAAIQQAAQYKTDIASAYANPTPQAFAALALKYPQQREAVKQAWDGLSEGDRKAEGDTMAQAYSALLAGRKDIAQQVVQSQIDARKNSGLDTSHYDTALKMLDGDEKQALGALGFTLSHINDPKAFATQFGALRNDQRSDQLQGDLVRKGAADADTAVAGVDSAKSKAITDGVAAKYADQNALLDYEKKGWDIKALQSDIQYKRDQTRIETMKVALAKQDNALKRQELSLKIQDAQTARDDKLRTKVSDAESAAGSIDNMLNNIDRILAVAEEKKDGKPTGRGTALLRAAAGPLDSRLPTMQGDVADLESLVETLGSQAFLSQIPNIKGMGSLSNAEGEKLQSAFQNFSLKQSDGQIIANLREAQRLLKTGRGTISKRYGVPLGEPNTPAATGDRPPLSSFYR